MAKPAQQVTLGTANYGPVQLGNTKGRMIAVKHPEDAAFLHVDDKGLLCVIPWDEAIRRFGPVKQDG